MKPFFRFKCNFCDFLTNNRSKLTTHQNDKHFEQQTQDLHQIQRQLSSDENIFNCTFSGCYQCFQNRDLFKRHQKSHTYPQPFFKCISCHFMTEDNSIAKTHSEVHPIDRNQKSWNCPLCSMTSLCKYGVVSHIFIHYEENTIKCTYDGCQESFKTY